MALRCFSLIGSLALIFAGKLFPQVEAEAKALTATINFPVLLMKVMLDLLLFAGSIQMSERELKQERIPTTVLSTIGTVISVFIVGLLVYWLLPLLGLHVDYIYCLLFDAIISPADQLQRWLNQVIDNGKILVKFRQAMDVAVSIDLINFLLQKEAVFVPYGADKRLPLSNDGTSDYKSSVWPVVTAP